MIWVLLLIIIVLSFLYVKEMITSYNDWVDSENEIERLQTKLKEAEKTIYIYTINVEDD